MARNVLLTEVNLVWVRGRPGFGWIDGVMVALSCGGITVETARQ